MADRVGQQLGNYKLVRLLGRGGFAEVYLGEHVRLGTQAAIKVLSTQLATEDEAIFQQEACTIAALEHPHIVRVLDFDVQGGTPFLVMGYAANGTLRTRHSRGTRLPLETIVPYIKQVADALSYAHEEKLIHRDIKPENMLLGRRGEVLLSDFGIATVAQSSRYQGTQEVAGTVAYMVPEQVQGKPRPASDQFALGIVVYEWLAGERPFHGSFTEIATQHVLTPPPPLREKLPDLAPAVEEAVMIALAKDPKERFASVLAFATALEQTQQAHASIHFAPTQVMRPSTPLDPTIAVTPVNSPGAAAYLPTILPPKLEAQSGPSKSTALLTYRGHEEWVRSLAWSPDGKLISSASHDGSVQVWDAKTGTFFLSRRGHFRYGSAVSWSPDGRYVASGGSDNLCMCGMLPPSW
jgi:eukaryotic-like serine/threonine-protein kinase